MSLIDLKSLKQSFYYLEYLHMYNSVINGNIIDYRNSNHIFIDIVIYFIIHFVLSLVDKNIDNIKYI